MAEPITISAIAAAWKLLGSLHEKYSAWSVRRKTSKQALQMKARAEELMGIINKQILSGVSSDDPRLAPVIKEFQALLKQGAAPAGHDLTEDWIDRGRRPPAKKAAAKKAAPAKKAVAKKASAKKTAGKKLRAKKAVAKKAAVPAV